MMAKDSRCSVTNRQQWRCRLAAMASTAGTGMRRRPATEIARANPMTIGTLRSTECQPQFPFRSDRRSRGNTDHVPSGGRRPVPQGVRTAQGCDSIRRREAPERAWDATRGGSVVLRVVRGGEEGGDGSCGCAGCVELRRVEIGTGRLTGSRRRGLFAEGGRARRGI